ncbi:MAG: VanW family protein [Georgenia sp.]
MTHDRTSGRGTGEGAGLARDDGAGPSWDLDHVLAARRGDGDSPGDDDSVPEEPAGTTGPDGSTDPGRTTDRGTAVAEPATPADTAVMAPGAETEQMPPATPLARTSPLDEFEPETPRPRRGLAIGLVVLLVLAGAYSAAALLLGDRLPNGATAAGVPIGGLSEADARARLTTDLAAAQAELIPVTLQGENVSAIDPAAAGLALDIDATLDPLTGPAFDPRILWGRIFGAGEVSVVSTADEEALRAALETAATELDVSPVEGFIMFAGTTAEVTDPVPGTAVDIAAAQGQVTREWLTAERPLELPTREVAPAVGAAAVEEALITQAQPLVSGSVSVSVGGNVVELTPEALAANAVFVATDGALDLELDGAGLSDAVIAADPSIEIAGTDAKIVLDANFEPEIVPSTAGMGLDPADLARAVKTAGMSTNRTAVVELVEAEPEFTTAEAEALGVKEVIADFSTPMPYDPVRTENLVVGSRYVTGVLVEPGEEFSLLEALGPIVPGRGFVSSGVVEDGFSSTALGGGLSQLSTNMYNVGLMAGMDDVEHTPHSRWFARYPAGREATLWVPSKDMVWRNNTDYGVLVHAWVAGGRVHTRLWGTHVWDVDIATSDHYDITQPDTKYNPREDCVAESGGQSGFTVTVTRQRVRAGSPAETEDWTWTYQPWHHIVCGEPPSAGDEAPTTPAAEAGA